MTRNLPASPSTRTDLRGVPVSLDDTAALELFEQAVRQFQSYVGDAIGTIDRALALRPDFVLGHAFRAAALMTGGERRFFEMARTSIAAAEALLDRANDRERGLVFACRTLLDGDWRGACAAFDRVLVDHPRDIIALQTAHIFDFARGDATNLRDRVTRALPAWSPSVPGYSFVLGLHAFGLEECNQYDRALDTAMRALAIEPADAWSVHAAVHVREMRGEIDEGIHFLETRQQDWAPGNGFAFHNFWHLALFHLDRGNITRVLELYDRHVFPEPSDFAFQLLDATALLWRLHLLGIDVATRFEQVAAVWDTKLDGERGFYAFNDVHAMMAFAATRRDGSIGRLTRDLDESTTGINAMMAREVGAPVARAMVAFSTGRYSACLDDLIAVRDVAHRFGGSHAQRDLLTLTIIEAARRAGRGSLARHFLNERSVHRPGSALGWRLAAGT
jgi:tetratricopeptide (TPR) repeat protein